MPDNPYGPQIHWLTDEQYQKLVGSLRLQLNGVFRPFHQYGMDVFVTPAVNEVVKLCEDFGLRVRGVDKIMSIEAIRKQNGYDPTAGLE
jgi:hypothetical protein